MAPSAQAPWLMRRGPGLTFPVLAKPTGKRMILLLWLVPSVFVACEMWITGTSKMVQQGKALGTRL